MAYKVPASQGGGVLGLGGVIDVEAASETLRRKVVSGTIGAFTQNTTVKTNLGPLGFAGILEAGYFSFTTLPAGGALTISIVAYDASGNAEVILTAAADPETGTVREGKAFVLAATNVALDADDTIEVHTVADNNAVGTAQVGGRVTLMFKPIEDTLIDQ